MSVAIPIPLLQNLPDVNVTPAVGVDEYALTYDHGTAQFVLRAPFAGLLATGATVGATAQAQAFTLGVVSPFDAPAADSTTAWQVRKADKTTSVLNVDTTNARVGIGTSAPGTTLDINGSLSVTGNTNLAGLVYNPTNTAGFHGLKVKTLNAETNTLVLYADAGSNRVLTLNGLGNFGLGVSLPATRLDIDAGALTMAEMTAPTGVANKAMLYTKDNGAGKTQLCVKLGDNVEIVLATQA